MCIRDSAKWVHKLRPFPLGNPMAKLKTVAVGAGLETERALTSGEKRKLLDAADYLPVIGGRSRDRHRHRAELPDERPQRRREYSGASSTLGIAALIVVVVAVAVWFFEFRDSGSSGGAGTPGLGIITLPPQLNPTGRAAVAQEGRAAPNFRLHSLEGKEAQLSDYRGDFVLVNFWASWCDPCQRAAPRLRDGWREAARSASVFWGSR